jgi:hypothetical protein
MYGTSMCVEETGNSTSVRPWQAGLKINKFCMARKSDLKARRKAFANTEQFAAIIGTCHHGVVA